MFAMTLKFLRIFLNIRTQPDLWGIIIHWVFHTSNKKKTQEMYLTTNPMKKTCRKHNRILTVHDQIINPNRRINDSSTSLKYHKHHKTPWSLS